MTPHEAWLALTALVFVALYFRARFVFRNYRSQGARFKAFALRDRLVRLHAQNKISDELYDRLMKFANSSLVLSDRFDTGHLRKLITAAAKETSASDFANQIVTSARREKEIAYIAIGLLQFMVDRALSNSLSHPIKALELVLFSRDVFVAWLKSVFQLRATAKALTLSLQRA